MVVSIPGPAEKVQAGLTKDALLSQGFEILIHLQHRWKAPYGVHGSGILCYREVIFKSATGGKKALLLKQDKTAASRNKGRSDQ